MTERYGEYELLAQFARGGMAEVFLARRLGLEGFSRELVVKRMLPRLAADEACVRMFLDEARLTAGLQHPNIAQVHDLGRVDDTYFIAMELVDGPDLKSMLKAAVGGKAPLAPTLAAWIVARVAEGLAFAHGSADPVTGEPLHIVHRDVNHANILVSRHGGVKLTDFGVARADNRDAGATNLGGLKGKMGYIAPEQCLGDPFDHRADIFALGVVLYELLVRGPLFYKKSDLETLEAIVYDKPAPPSSIAQEVDEALDHIVLAMLAKDPSARPADAAVITAALDEWIAANGGCSRPELAAWVDEHVPDLCPTRRIPARTRHGSGSFRRWTTGEFDAMRGKPSGRFASTSSARRAVAAAEGPTTSRQNPLLGGRRREPAARSNLPRSRSLFVGRDAELARIAGLFATSARLVTLFGSPGVGKSRAASHYGRKHLDAAPDATVWLCGCAEARTAGDVSAALSRALGVPLVGATTAEAEVEQLGHALAARGRTLVIWDDFDRLITHFAATLGRWLELAPDARFLVTSRTLLRQVDEVAVDIPALATAGDEPSEAEQLFIERARAARPGWQPAASERETIRAIVKRLDGLPLALELAAARIAVLGPQRLLERLARRFEVLRDGAAGRAGKPRTLRSAIDWSWESLSEAERSALTQCTVFRGGFTMEAAESVVDLAEIPDVFVLDVIQSLRDRSMLRICAAAGPGEEPRFSMFSSIRAYAVDKARGPETLARATRRHAAYFLELAQRCGGRVTSHDGHSARRELAADMDNLVTVHRRALARRPHTAANVDAALRIAAGLFRLMVERGPMALALRLLGEAVAAADEALPGHDALAAGLAALGEAHARAGRPKVGLGWADRAIEEADKAGSQRLLGEAIVVKALCNWLTDDHEPAMSAGARARAIAQSLGNVELEARALNLVGCVHFSSGNRDAALACLAASITAAQHAGHLHVEAVAHSNIGCLYADRGELDDAERFFRRALQDCTELRNRRGVGVNRCELAVVAQERGDFRAARRHFKRAIAALSEVGDRHRLATAMWYAGWFELEDGNTREAAVLLERARDFYATGSGRAAAMIIATVAYLQAFAGDLTAAEASIADAVERARQRDEADTRAVVLAMQGGVDAVTAIRLPPADGLERMARARRRLKQAAGAIGATDAAPAVRWSKEARYAVRMLRTLLAGRSQSPSG